MISAFPIRLAMQRVEPFFLTQKLRKRIILNLLNDSSERVCLCIHNSAAQTANTRNQLN